MTKVECAVCKKQHLIPDSRVSKYKTCSMVCLGVYKTKIRITNATCTQCKVPFFLKEYKLNKVKLGTFCTAKCSSEFKKIYFLGKNNPNYRARMYDTDGYIIDHIPKIGRVKIHQYIALKHLGLEKIPTKHHVHHRDCNIHNNDITNLAVLSQADHQWLHKQYGSATLWAFYHNKIALNSLISWSNDQVRARTLLTTNLTNQIGVFKSCELLENPEKDNQQPSASEME